MVAAAAIPSSTVGTTEVNSDSYSFPSTSGVQDRIFSSVSYTNNTPNAVSVEVSVTGSRSLTTPAGLVGTTFGKAWIVVTNETDSLLVGSTQDYMPSQILAQGAGVTNTFTESTVFVVSVPSGKEFSFEPRFRIAPSVGSSGNCALDTYAYTMRVTSIQV